MNFLAFDLETSGFSPDKHAILEIACIPIINGVKKDPFVSYVRPHEGAILDPKALEANGLTVAQIKSFPEASEMLKNFIVWLDSHNTIFNLLAHNLEFDRKFLYKFFTLQGAHSDFVTRFDNKGVCTLDLSRGIFLNKKAKPASNKLSDLCKFFKIELNNAHSALPDIEATYEVYQNLKAMIPAPMLQEQRILTYQEKRTKYLDRSYIQFNANGDIYIDSKMTKDPNAARFIAEEIYRLYGA